MVHRIVVKCRGQPLLPDHGLGGLAPLLVVGAEKLKDGRDRLVVAADRRRKSAVALAASGAQFVDRRAAMPVEALAQLVGGADQATRRGEAGPRRGIEDRDEAVSLAVVDPLDAGPDIGTIGTVERAVNGAARDAVLAGEFPPKK